MSSTIPPAIQVRQCLASMAIEEMYFSKEFVEKLLLVAEGKLSSEEVRREVIKKYAG